MTIFVLILYMLLSLLDAGIAGGLLAFILSRGGRLVSFKFLAVAVLAYTIAQDILMCSIAAPLKLTLSTGNPLLIRLLGSSNLSELFELSFGISDIGFYAIDAIVGAWIGTTLIRCYNRNGISQ